VYLKSRQCRGEQNALSKTILIIFCEMHFVSSSNPSGATHAITDGIFVSLCI